MFSVIRNDLGRQVRKGFPANFKRPLTCYNFMSRVLTVDLYWCVIPVFQELKTVKININTQYGYTTKSLWISMFIKRVLWLKILMAIFCILPIKNTNVYLYVLLEFTLHFKILRFWVCQQEVFLTNYSIFL